jgi:hypothetical protein
MCMPISSALRSQVDQIKLKYTNGEVLEKTLVEVAKDGEIKDSEVQALKNIVDPTSHRKLDRLLGELKSVAQEHIRRIDSPIASERVASTEALLNRLLGVNDHANQIHNTYDGSRRTPSDTPLTDLTPNGMYLALDKISQSDNDNSDYSKYDEKRCSGASLVGAAMLNGKEGIKTFIDSLGEFCNKKSITLSDEDFALLDKVGACSDLKTSDISKLQDLTYRVLKSYEGTELGSGVRGETIKSFLNEVPKIKNLLRKIGGSIEGIDNVGNTATNHVVLKFEHRNERGQTSLQIYDPYPKRDGKQIISDPEMVRKYTRVSMISVK